MNDNDSKMILGALWFVVGMLIGRIVIAVWP